MKILDWAIGWVRSLRPGLICFYCGKHESEDPTHAMLHYKDVLVCRKCLNQPMASYALDMMYWHYQPEKIPPCKHCRKVVPAAALDPVARDDWYFCVDCASNDNVRLYWERTRRRMWERQAKELGLRRR